MLLLFFLVATKESVWMVLYFDVVDGVDGSDVFVGFLCFAGLHALDTF